MTRNIFIFLATFVVGALGALVTRAALHKPYAGNEPPAATREYSAMVTNALTPARATDADASAPATRKAQGAEPAPGHSGHDHAGPAAPTAKPADKDHSVHGKAAEKAPGGPVNTVCAICGMDVDPSLPTAQYQGQTIGFGCRMCPPKFKADPDKYGPYYLRNETIKR